MASDDPQTWSWTVDEMLAERPCAQYDRTRITALWAGRERLSLREILALDIPDADKVWVLTRRHWPAWIECILTRAVRHHVLSCGVPQVEQWAARWLDGTDRSADASKAAARAASSAASSAAWAARAAARAAEAAEAEAAAWAEAAEAEAAAWAAAAAAAAAERARQVQDARDLLEEVRDGE